jgi:hypothetical protein
MKSLFDATDTSDVVLWRLFTGLLVHLEDSTAVDYHVWSTVDTVLYRNMLGMLENHYSDVALGKLGFTQENVELQLETPLFNTFEGFEFPLMKLRNLLDDSVLTQCPLDFDTHSRIQDTFYGMWSTFVETPNEFEGLCLALDMDD